MPLDLGPSNSIVQSFLAGSQLKRQRQQDVFEKQKEVSRKEEEQKRFQEQVRQFDAKLAEDLTQFQAQQKYQAANLDIAQLAAKQAAVEHYLKTGAMPPGFTQGPVTNVPTSQEGFTGPIQDQFQTLTRINPVTMQDESVQVPTLPTYARQQSEVKSIMDAPEVQARKELERMKLDYETQQKNAALAAQTARDQRQHNFRLAEIAARNKGRVNPLDRPIDPRTQVEYFGNYDPRRTLATGFGNAAKALTPVQQKELTDLDNVTSAAQSILNMLNPDLAVNDKELAAVSKNRTYFNQTGGMIDTLGAAWKDFAAKARGGEVDKNASDIATALANLEQKIGLANFGKVIPSGEKEMLTKIAPTANHRQTIDSIISKAEEIIKRNEATKLTALGIAKTPQPNQQDTGNAIDLSKFRVK